MLPYGEAQDGRLRHVSEVPSGLACGCACPECGAPLEAHKGEQIAHHFQHAGGAACAGGGGLETALHKLAKQVIADEGWLSVPSVEAFSGGRHRVVLQATRFRPTSVAIEVAMPGMQPDIVARKADRQLLVEIAVTHPCEPDKLARIRERQLAAVEIDLSKVRRDAPHAALVEAILEKAPRKWLFNRLAAEAEAALAADVARDEAREKERQARALAAEARKLVEAWRRPVAMAATARRDAAETRQRLSEAGMLRLVGKDLGDGGFAAPSETWQALVVEKFAIQYAWRLSQFSAAEVLDVLRDAKLLKPGLDGYVGAAAAAAARALEPAFLAPWEAVNAYLAALAEDGALDRWNGHWSARNEVVQKARAGIKGAEARRRRLESLRGALSDLLAALGDGHGVDPEAWMGARIEALGGTPEQLAAAEGTSRDILWRLEKLRAMLAPGGRAEAELLGLPLEAARAARLEEQRQREEAERQRREAAERQAAERRKAEAADRKRRVLDKAERRLGDQELAAWRAAGFRCLGGRSVDEVEGLEPDQAGTVGLCLDEAIARYDAAVAREQDAARLRARLEAEAASAIGPDKARLWMNSGHPALGGRHPSVTCVDEDSYQRCLALIKPAKAPRRR